MISTRFAAALLTASVALSLVSLREARAAGTLEQAVESAFQGNGGSKDVDIQKVQIGRHGFYVRPFTIQNNGDTLVATGYIRHLQKGKDDRIHYSISVTASTSDVTITRTEYRGLAHLLGKLTKVQELFAKGFRYTLSAKFGRVGAIVGKAGEKLGTPASIKSILQGNWEEASMTVLDAIATRVQAEIGRSS